MAMAHSVGKPFHLISDAEAGEACTRRRDKRGGALHTPAAPTERRHGLCVEATEPTLHT